MRRRIHSAKLPPMKVVFYIFGIIAIAMFALAQENTTPPQEKTTPPPRVYPVALPNYDEETAHLIQACARHAEDWGGRSMDARSSAGDLHDLHDQG